MADLQEQPPPTRKETLLRKSGRVVNYTTIMVVGIAAVLGGSWWAVQWLSQDAVDEAEVLVELLKKGDHEAAWNLTAPQLRAREALDVFTENTSPLKDHTGFTWTRRTADEAGARLEASFVQADGRARTMTITQLRRDAGWPVARIRFGVPASPKDR